MKYCSYSFFPPQEMWQKLATKAKIFASLSGELVGLAIGLNLYPKK